MKKVFSYALLHLRRDLKGTCAAMLCFLTVLYLIASVHSSILSRQKMLEDMANAVIIRGDVTDSTGYNTEGIDIPLNLHRLITDPNGTLHPYVDEVYMKVQDRWTHMYERTYQTTDENNEPVEEVRMQEEDIRVIAINSPQADMTISGTEGAIQYAEGYDESMFSLTENLCILGRDVDSAQDENGRAYIDLLVDPFSEPTDNNMARFYVAGTTDIKGLDNTIFIPYAALNACCPYAKSFILPLYSLSFTIHNNNLLSQFRDLAFPSFRDGAGAAKMEDAYVLVLQDASYLELTHEGQKTLRMMQILQPILYLCALGAGVMLVVMQMRGRKKEMAVIRSLGAGRFRAMAQTILEYALICLPVTLFALLVWRELSPMTVIGVWMAFMAGALCTIVRFSMIPLVKQIRELEE